MWLGDVDLHSGNETCRHGQLNNLNNSAIVEMRHLLLTNVLCTAYRTGAREAVHCRTALYAMSSGACHGGSLGERGVHLALACSWLQRRMVSAMGDRCVHGRSAQCQALVHTCALSIWHAACRTVCGAYIACPAKSPVH